MGSYPVSLSVEKSTGVWIVVIIDNWMKLQARKAALELATEGYQGAVRKQVLEAAEVYERWLLR